MSDHITKSIIVKGDVSDVFGLWADFSNFPNFMKYIKSVTRTGDLTSRWQMEGPLGKDVEWVAEVTRFEPSQRIGWNTKGRNGDSDVTTSGQVTFTELPHHETEVTVMMQYKPPAGVLGEAVAKIFSNPEERVMEDLRNFKKYAEGHFDRLPRD
jgi:uncharacterized membrane protein